MIFFRHDKLRSSINQLCFGFCNVAKYLVLRLLETILNVFDELIKIITINPEENLNK